MGRYLIRRLLQFIPTVIGAMFLLHYITSLGMQINGNPVRALFGDRTPPQTLLDALSAKFGLDDPCLNQLGNPCLGLFGRRMGDIFFHFDFGVNFRFQEVTDIIARALPWTGRLALIAFVTEAIIGIAAGVLAGLRGGSFWDYVVKISTVLFISVPIFVLGVAVREFVGVGLGKWLRENVDWLPTTITHGVFGGGFKVEYPWASLVLPGLVLASVSMATAARLTRTSIMENMRSDYVRTAKAKGLTRRRVIGVHTLRNSLIPAITFLGVDIGALLGGAVVTETIFNVPGIGREVARSARSGEASVVIGLVALAVLIYLLANLLVDLLYAALDPRIRYE